MPSLAHTPPFLMARLLEFNLLPSRSLHAERAQALLDAGPAPAHLLNQPAVQRALHRRWSAELLARLGDHAAPVHDVTLPALPLALAAQPLLARLVRDAGVLLLGGHLRRTIAREPVLQARTELGADSLAWARNGAAQLHPGLDDAQPWLGAGWAPAADALGSSLLAQAWHDAPAPLRLRADWKLPPAADSAATRQASGLQPAAARAVCLQLLSRLDPAWLSNFPATR